MRIILLLCAVLALTIAGVPVEEVPAAQEIHQVDGELPVEIEVEEVKILGGEKKSSCPTRWSKFGSRCFIFIDREMTWVEAEHYCLRYSTNLASIHNQEEYEFLQQLVSNRTGRFAQTWLGLNDAMKNDVWLWSDGSSSHYQHWSYGEPNNFANKEHCVVMNHQSDYFHWGDVSCEVNRPFVCGTRPLSILRI